MNIKQTSQGQSTSTARKIGSFLKILLSVKTLTSYFQYQTTNFGKIFYQNQNHKKPKFYHNFRYTALAAKIKEED